MKAHLSVESDQASKDEGKKQRQQVSDRERSHLPLVVGNASNVIQMSESEGDTCTRC